MAKSIALRLAGESSSFTFSRLDRDKLYGRKERQVVDPEGRRCTSAYLSSDGAALVPAGGLAMLYVNEQFATVERSTLRAVDSTGVVAVRKYVLIETNKPGRDWPPLVLHCVDYSPGRAEPLQVSWRTADTRETADIQIAAWIE